MHLWAGGRQPFRATGIRTQNGGRGPKPATAATRLGLCVPEPADNLNHKAAEVDQQVQAAPRLVAFPPSSHCGTPSRRTGRGRAEKLALFCAWSLDSNCSDSRTRPSYRTK